MVLISVAGQGLRDTRHTPHEHPLPLTGAEKIQPGDTRALPGTAIGRIERDRLSIPRL